MKYLADETHYYEFSLTVSLAYKLSYEPAYPEAENHKKLWATV